MSRGLKKVKDDRFPAHVTCNRCGFREINKHFDPNVSMCGDCSGEDISYIRGHMECKKVLEGDDQPRGPGRPTDNKKIAKKICGSIDIEWPEKMPSLCNTCGETKLFGWVDDDVQLRWHKKRREFVTSEDFKF